MFDGKDKAKAAALGQVFIRPSFFAEGKEHDLWLPLVKDSPKTGALRPVLLPRLCCYELTNAVCGSDAELSKLLEGLQLSKPLGTTHPLLSLLACSLPPNRSLVLCDSG